jgi:site-specific DNA-cytosine methylase
MRRNDGVSPIVDRLKSLGNAVVPQVVEVIGEAIMEVDRFSPKREE